MTYPGLDVFPAEFKLIIEFQACLSIIGLKLISQLFSSFLSFSPAYFTSLLHFLITLHLFCSFLFYRPFTSLALSKDHRLSILNTIFFCLPGPRWASWNLGIFICIRCAGIHRNLGVHISKVKSVNLDQWTQEQVQVRGHTTDGHIKMRTLANKYYCDILQDDWVDK